MYSVEWALPKHGGKKFICIENGNGKQWYIPCNAVKVGLEVYQPTSLKGKLLKAGLSIKQFRFILVKFMHGISVQERTLLPEIQTAIEALLGEKLEYSCYIGDASIPQNRKLVIQIYRDQTILAYAKVTKEDCVKQIFKHEQEVLCRLSQAGVENVPEVLTAFSKEAIEGFVQSTKKERGFHTLHTYGAIQDEFLKNMQKPFIHQALSSELPCIRDLKKLNDYMREFSAQNQKILQSALCYIETFAPQAEMNVSLAHRDFTPWNSFFQRGTFFAFDFEYAQWNYPTHYDALHYCIQPFIVSTKKINAKKVLNNVKDRILWGNTIGPSKKMEIAIYLLDQLLFYIERTSKGIQEIETGMKNIALLEELFKDEGR